MKELLNLKRLFKPKPSFETAEQKEIKQLRNEIERLEYLWKDYIANERRYSEILDNEFSKRDPRIID